MNVEVRAMKTPAEQALSAAAQIIGNRYSARRRANPVTITVNFGLIDFIAGWD